MARVKIALLALSTLTLVSSVSATLPTVNWTEISDFIAGVADIFPGIISLVLAIVPVMIVMGVISLVLGIFAGIVMMMQRVF